jgi:hypothetical protein
MESIYLKLQLLGYECEQELKKNTSALRRYCKYFHLTLQADPRWPDTFWLLMPDDPVLFCEVVNAMSAYCHYYPVSARYGTDRVTVPFEGFLKVLHHERRSNE